MPTFYDAAMLSGFAGGMFAFAMCSSLVFYIIWVIAGWKIFEKAGEAGWKSLIPIYNLYIFYKIVKMENWFFAMIAVSFVISFITTILGQGAQLQNVNFSTGVGMFSGLLLIGLVVFSLYVSAMYAARTAKAFGRGSGFAIGLFFLQFIFLLILVFGDAKYKKKVVKGWE